MDKERARRLFLTAFFLFALANGLSGSIISNYFKSLPPALEESAKIDGATDLRILWSIALPLSIPSIATITLFYAVGFWNSYFNVTLYISKSGSNALVAVAVVSIKCNGYPSVAAGVYLALVKDRLNLSVHNLRSLFAVGI